MTVLNYTFKNNGVDTYNDDVFDYSAFELEDHEYAFVLRPSTKTKYWRFGIRLSKSKEVIFYNPNGRYTTPPPINTLEDVNIGVGDFNNNSWSGANKIHLAQYHLTSYPQEINVCQTYIEFSQVNMRVKYDKIDHSIIVSYSSIGCVSAETKLPVSIEYKYFKIFAWADQREFKIDCEIQIDPPKSKATKSVIIESASQFSITNNFTPVIEVKELAQEIGEILKVLRDDTGNMFGIFGKWGRGKTLLWKEVWEYLSKNSQNTVDLLKIEFHAWRYQDTPASWAYLYETLADKYFYEERYINHQLRKKTLIRKRIEFSLPFSLFYLINEVKGFFAISKDFISKFQKRIKLNSERIGYRPVILFLIGFLFFVTWLFIPLNKKFEWGLYLISTFGIIFILKVIYLYFMYKAKALNILSKYSSKVSFEKYLGIQAEIQKEIIFLMRSWIPSDSIVKRKIILFVDDIDRCTEDKIIQVVDSLKVMLEDEEISKRILIVTALDERVLKMAIGLKYHDLIAKSITPVPEHNTLLNILTREYVDKLFICGVKLGELSINERIDIFNSITKDKINKSSTSPQAGDTDSNLISAGQTNQPTSNNPSDAINNINEFEAISGNESFEIEQHEYDMLKLILSRFNDATPRSIRIYYYRYMLAKKIMKYKFQKNQQLFNKWIAPANNKYILPALIVHFSRSSIHKELENEFELLEDNYKPIIIRKFLDMHFEVEADLYAEVLKIVEMVVPY